MTLRAQTRLETARGSKPAARNGSAGHRGASSFSIIITAFVRSSRVPRVTILEKHKLERSCFSQCSDQQVGTLCYLCLFTGDVFKSGPAVSPAPRPAAPSVSRIFLCASSDCHRLCDYGYTTTTCPSSAFTWCELTQDLG